MRVSLQSQIAAMAAEIAGSARKLPKAQQDLHKEQLRAVLRTLKCLIKHEQMLRTRCPELDLFESERRP